MPASILGVLRTFSMLLNYLISYILYPKRIIRTLKNIFRKGSVSSTVLEHRLKDIISRSRFIKRSEP